MGGIVGNILEWYDFAVFGYFAPIIGAQFFPSSNRVASLLGAFGVFAGAYFMRPLGAAFFGSLGDRLGRKHALQLSVFLMAIPTTAMAILPTYQQVGWFAPLLLTLCRLVQGVSVGGELIGSVAYVTEIAPRRSRGLYGSFVVCSSTAGVMLGSAVAALLSYSLGEAAMASWGWRLPFAAGLVLGLVGYWMRDGLEDSPEYTQTKEEGGLSSRPVREVVGTMWGQICRVANLVMLSGSGFYLLFVWWPTYIGELVEPRISSPLLLNTMSMLVLVVCTPIAGWLSDVFGRRRVLATSVALLAVVVVPLFRWTSTGGASAALTSQLVFAVLMAGVSGPIPATMMELFPTRTRYSGVALGYNISLALFGGTAPLMATLLISRTGSMVAPAYYLIYFAAVSFVACCSLHDFAPADRSSRLTRAYLGGRFVH